MMATENISSKNDDSTSEDGGEAAKTSVKSSVVADASKGDSGVSPASVPVSSVSLGRYRLCFELARGGMATVYLAKLEGRASVERFVAVKVVHPHLTHNMEFVEMFLDEARIASRLQHANVCRVIDFDADESSGHFIVMEYLEGEPLSAVFRAMVKTTRGSPPHRAARVARVIADACEGLHAAHELTDEHGDSLGVVHRDISPDNIFLTYDGVAKVVDFGVATATIQHHETRTGVIKGKYAYLPPEVLSGKKPDRRADIWSMGVVLWELLTQKRLFHRESDLETLKSIQDPKILAPSQARPGLPDYYDAIVMKALACDPDARYQTARELGRALTHVLARRRLAVGLAELSEWMDELFPAGRACKRQTVEIASRLDETATVRDPFARASTSLYEKPTRVSDESAPSSDRGVPSTHRLLRAAPLTSLPLPKPPPFADVADRRVQRWLPRRDGLIMLGAAAVVFIASVGVSQGFASGVPIPPPSATAPRQASAAEPPVQLAAAPYVVEIQRAADSDPDSVLLRIRPDIAQRAQARQNPPRATPDDDSARAGIVARAPRSRASLSSAAATLHTMSDSVDSAGAQQAATAGRGVTLGP